MMKEDINVNDPIDNIPISCTFICDILSSPVSKIVKSLKRPTASVPQIPAAK